MSRHVPKKVKNKGAKFHTGGIVTLKPAPTPPILNDSVIHAYQGEAMKALLDRETIGLSFLPRRERSTAIQFKLEHEAAQPKMDILKSTVDFTTTSMVIDSFDRMNHTPHTGDMQQMLDDINRVERTPNERFNDAWLMARKSAAARLKRIQEEMTMQLFRNA